MQDDNLQPLLTVQEAMNLAGDLKIGKEFSTKEKKNRVSTEKNISNSIVLENKAVRCVYRLKKFWNL